MNNGFTKLFSSLVTSTIWTETNPTRIVWITMLAMSDRDGDVSASVPGLARTANVTLRECETALAAFMAPDKYSRTQENEGRRIAVKDGGWHLLNHEKYREQMRGPDRREYLRVKQAEHRARLKSVSKSQPMSTTINHDQPIAETEAEADTVLNTRKPVDKTAEQLRAEKLFHRRPSTAWDKSCQKAWAGAKAAVTATTENEWVLLEAFHAAPDTYHRRDLATLLNNWTAEIDRARNFKTNGRSNQPRPTNSRSIENSQDYSGVTNHN